MPNYVFSFIGTGSMGSALARAACRSVPPEKVLLANRTYSKAQALANALGCVPAAISWPRSWRTMSSWG